MAGFTIAQVDRMTSYVVKNELLALGVDPASIRKLRVAQLRERLKDELGLTSFEYLIQALMNCNMSKGTAEQIATTQGFAGLDCLKVLSPDDLEDTIGRHNKAMTGGNEQHKIFSTIVIRRLEALVHSVRVYSLELVRASGKEPEYKLKRQALHGV